MKIIAEQQENGLQVRIEANPEEQHVVDIVSNGNKSILRALYRNHLQFAQEMGLDCGSLYNTDFDSKISTDWGTISEELKGKEDIVARNVALKIQENIINDYRLKSFASTHIVGDSATILTSLHHKNPTAGRIQLGDRIFEIKPIPIENQDLFDTMFEEQASLFESYKESEIAELKSSVSAIRRSYEYAIAKLRNRLEETLPLKKIPLSFYEEGGMITTRSGRICAIFPVVYTVTEIIRNKHAYAIRKEYIPEMPCFLEIKMNRDYNFVGVSLTELPYEHISLPVWHGSFDTCTGGTAPEISSPENLVKARDILMNGFKRINTNSLAPGSVYNWLKSHEEDENYEKIVAINNAIDRREFDEDFFKVCKKKPLSRWKNE